MKRTHWLILALAVAAFVLWYVRAAAERRRLGFTDSPLAGFHIGSWRPFATPTMGSQGGLKPAPIALLSTAKPPTLGSILAMGSSSKPHR